MATGSASAAVVDRAPCSSSAAARTRIKTARRSKVSPPRCVLRWPDVLRAVVDDTARSVALSAYRARGFTPDDFGRLRAAREAMSDALSRVEGQLELARPTPARDRARSLVRGVRRRLEVELWP